MLTASLLGSSFALSCTPDASFKGTHALVVPAGAARVVTLVQNGADLLLELHYPSGEIARFNHPGSRHGIELIYLPATQNERHFELCVYTVYQDANTEADYQISELAGQEALPASTHPALLAFTEAGRLWAEEDSASQASALMLYEELAALDIGYLSLSRHAALNAITANNNAYHFERARFLLQAYAATLTTDVVSSYSSYRELGYALLRQRQHKEAEIAFRQALQLVPDAYTHEQGEIMSLLGEVVLSQGRFDEGASILKAALEDIHSDSSLLSSLHNNMGYFYLLQAGNDANTADEKSRYLQESINEHLLARVLALEADNKTGLQIIENNLGSLYERTGELRKANHHFRESLRLAIEIDASLGLRVIYQNLGTLNLALGDYLKSRTYLEQALQLAAAEDDAMSIRLNCLLGTNLRLLGELEQAVEHHGNCLNSASSLDNQLMQIEAQLELAQDYLSLREQVSAALTTLNLQPEQSANARENLLSQEKGHQQLASENLDRAWVLADDILVQRYKLQLNKAQGVESNICQDTSLSSPERVNTTADSSKEYDFRLFARVLLRKATMERMNGAYTSALLHTANALNLPGSNHYQEQIEALESAMLIYAAQNDPQKSLVCGELNIKKIEALHEQLEADRNGPAWTARTHEVYVSLADLLLQQYYQAPRDNAPALAAFSIIERSRNISLRQQLSMPKLDVQKADEARLLTSINELAERYVAPRDEVNSGSLPLHYYYQHDLLELSRLSKLDSIPIPPALSLEEIQQKLGNGQLVLYYFLADKKACLFAISRDEFSIHEIGNSTELLALTKQVEEAGSTGSPDLESTLLLLSQRLLPEDLILSGNEELIVVPHRALNLLPFAALSVKKQNGYQLLIDDHRLITTPSLSTYFMEKPEQQPYSTDLAVFADPVFNTDSLSRSGALITESVPFRSWSKGLQPLPFTELEARSLEDIFGPDRTLTFVGNRATLDNLASEEARTARILHIATHGYFHSTSSDNVGLVLSAVNEHNEAVSNFVTLTELFSHTFNNELVVISGCDTAMGLQLSGEGMMGLTRGFIAQGAKNVISTLWPVNDRSAYLFMTYFYKELYQSGNVSRSLQHAQNQLRSHKEYSAPYHWAPYILTTADPQQEMIF